MQLSNVATMPLTEAFIDNKQHNYLVVDKERQLHWCLKQQNRAFINKNGIRVVLQKNWEDSGKTWLVSGYGLVDEIGKLTIEATETIKTVNAQYGYKPEHSRLCEQVGAVIASISSIRQQQEKSRI